MYLIVDEQRLVTEGYASGLEREGVATSGFAPDDFLDWMEAAHDADFEAVEAILIGECVSLQQALQVVRRRCQKKPLIILDSAPSLDHTLKWFAAGVDDVLRKPVHPQEILARVNAIRRRSSSQPMEISIGDLTVFFDGRDPEAKGEPLALPRRERRILEYLARNNGRRLTKTQIYNFVYGIFESEVDENVIESHISKLRKKLRSRMGYDPIDSKRYLGYIISPN
ncbi:response regulator transcription factor [Rhodobacteraceae bacterium RKSG542]|uniref:response regulator transcription factor n=1 Tax=Pseudovibrio flavus TaxID=2529854 RepID=UPI0012BCC51E|nr:response regulator transcription factor [Pseudovibrio flavus]MTI16946.1 response regulator transcription factor [Pseudovibrio flavus]